MEALKPRIHPQYLTPKTQNPAPMPPVVKRDLVSNYKLGLVTQSQCLKRGVVLPPQVYCCPGVDCADSCPWLGSMERLTQSNGVVAPTSLRIDAFSCKAVKDLLIVRRNSSSGTRRAQEPFFTGGPFSPHTLMGQAVLVSETDGEPQEGKSVPRYEFQILRLATRGWTEPMINDKLELCSSLKASLADNCSLQVHTSQQVSGLWHAWIFSIQDRFESTEVAEVAFEALVSRVEAVWNRVSQSSSAANPGEGHEWGEYDYMGDE